MKKQNVLIAVTVILLFGIGSAFGQEVSDEAKRHFDRGVAAVEMAKSPNDYAAAIMEFEQAARLAPDWPDVYYSLGKVQEAAEKYGDAVQSLRKYLQLAPDADNAEEVKSLINRLEYKAIPVLSVSKGFMGIPWGSNAEQITEVMNNQGYECSEPSSSHLNFYATIGRDPYLVAFSMQENSLYEASSSTHVRSHYPRAAQMVFNKQMSILSQEYGPPKGHTTGTYKIDKERDNVLHSEEHAVWNIVDSRTSEKYTISIWYMPTWFTTADESNYIFVLSNRADSLYERFNKKGAGINAQTQPISLPQDINAKNQFGDTPLHSAALRGQKDLVESLIARGADINAKDSLGQTPLHIAAISGHKEVAEMLIAKGADINARNISSDTPLHVAALLGKTEVAELLITKGADINARVSFGRTPLQVAESNNHKDVADLLRKHGAKDEKERATTNAPAPAAPPAAKAVDIDARDANGRTRLLSAIWQNQNDLALQLITQGADVKAKDLSGLTPLHVASCFNQAAIAELLIAKGADINTKDQYGFTPLHSAALDGSYMTARLLIAKGADINALNNDGHTPLYVAIISGDTELAELLITKGANVNIKDKKGKTPLQEAIRYGYKELADLLRKHGAR
jgi:ankyrin repeat protein